MLQADVAADSSICRETTLSSRSGTAAEMLSQLTAQHRQVLSYWEGLRGSKAAPSHRELDPAAIRQALPNVLIWQVDEGGDYRCRLSGTAVDETMGAPLKSRTLGDIPCSLIDEARREFDGVRDDGVPCLAERTMLWAGKTHLYYRHLLLPLTGDSGAVERLLSVLTFHSLENEPSYVLAG